MTSNTLRPHERALASLKEYLAQHPEITSDETQNGGPPHPDAKMIRALNSLAKDKMPNEFSLVLDVFLLKKGISCPEGVLPIRVVYKGPGRPAKDAIEELMAYEDLAVPTAGKVARTLYPDEYAKEPKKLRDRVRKRIQREKERLSSNATQLT